MHKLRLSIVAALLASVLAGNSAFAQPARDAGEQQGVGHPIAASAQANVDNAQPVQAMAKRGLPAAPKNSKGAVPALNGEKHGVPFRPTMGDDAYKAAKAAADSQRGAPNSAAPNAAKPLAPSGPLAPPNLVQGPFYAADESNGTPFDLIPPDVELAAGGGVSQEVVQTVNTSLFVFDHSGNVLSSTTLNAFFGKPANTFNDLLFDARVLYDHTWNRWVILADAFAPNSTTPNLVWLAISQTDDATGGFYIYAFSPTGTAFQNGDFFDYPILGMDQDAIQFTGNVFGASTFKGAYLLSIAKANLYNGLGFGIPIFTGLCATLTPTVVYDQNANTYLTCGGGNRNNVPLYRLNNSSHPNSETLVVQANLPVAAYSVPPSATQPGTTATADTLDARFQNVGTQIGCFVYQVHTINLGGGFPAPDWYRFNTCNNTTELQQIFFASGTSNDWNPSIAANGNGEVFVTWSTDDPPAGIEPSVQIGGSPNNGATAIGAGTQIDPGLSFSTEGRWGDYSAVSLDPVPGVSAGCGPNRHVWISNQLMQSSNFWSTDIAQTGYCS